MVLDISIQYFLLAVLYTECMVGLTVNMIMLAANLVKWKSLRSLQTCDKILSSLAISRGLYFLSITIRNSFYQFFPWLQQSNIMLSALYVQVMFMFYTTQWLVTLLCVFYCVKIVTYNYKLFIFLKTRISTMVPWLILSSLLISLISSLPYGWYGYNDLELHLLSNDSTGNMTVYQLVIVPNYDHRILIFALGNIPPFVIFCVSVSLLIHFLLIHTRQMRSNESHIQSPNLKSHFGALKSMSLFLLLQIMYFIFMNLFTSGRFFHFAFLILLRWILLSSLSLLHSLYMISSSTEVIKMFTSMCFCHIRSS
ncbi:taste receptor type 2 member 40-like [Hyla sarda]|uniref:taste receptor type 2 member 40-like n=1 Tax=Hyla sarda TaxID=327740 RepID=UPI0024C297C5|nr:taste receptor type 2 member 40-like [Hyla sarda]